jgi:hypothetical protein
MRKRRRPPAQSTHQGGGCGHVLGIEAKHEEVIQSRGAVVATEDVECRAVNHSHVTESR